MLDPSQEVRKQTSWSIELLAAEARTFKVNTNSYLPKANPISMDICYMMIGAVMFTNYVKVIEGDDGREFTCKNNG